MERRGGRPSVERWSLRERRQADLFFADLVGWTSSPVPAVPRPGWRPVAVARPRPRPRERPAAPEALVEDVAPYLVDQGRAGRGFVSRGPDFPGRIHAAQDIAGPRGSGVHAALDGVVIHAGRRRGYGNLVILRHGAPEDITTAYAHLDSLGVRVGDAVRGGQPLGTMGNSTEGPDGDSAGVRAGMGVHLHFSIQRAPAGWGNEQIAQAYSSRYEERGDIRVEPAPWLAARGIALFREPVARSPLASEAIGDDLSERSTTATAAIPLPAPISSKWVGVDRSSIPKHTVGGASVADTDWMGTLIDNSNLRFTGAYVTGPAPAGQTATAYTGSSKAVGRAWIPNVQTLADQGWGIAFFYVGYSMGGGEPIPAGGTNRARGILHGAHLRGILNGLGAAWAGATVFIDNEDSTGTSLSNDLVDYYLGIFDEMSRPDPALAAFRPGFYGHGTPVEQMLARRRDLFVWQVHLATSTTTTPTAPFVTTVDPVTVDPATRPLSAVSTTPAAPPAGAPRFASWSLGRQFWYYTGNMAAAGSAVASRLPAWRPVATWDYNTSLVRNPAFPVAEPRIAALASGATQVGVAGFFQPRGTGAPPVAPASSLRSQEAGGSTVLAIAAGGSVEPDAPVCLFRRGSGLVLATVLAAPGTIGVATRASGAAGSPAALGAWSVVAAISGAVPALRRGRALQGVSRTATDSQLFFVGGDDRLYVKRLTGAGSVWTDGQPVDADLRLHPFSALAAETRGGDTVDTFFIDRQGLLTTAFWARWFTTPYPSFLVQRLEAAPSLLPASALATTCPQANHLLVFAVGADGRLAFAYFIDGTGWSGVAASGGPADVLGAHTRLAARAVSATEVEVAALSDAGQLLLYTFRLTGPAWAAGSRAVVANPPPLVGAAAAVPAGAVMQAADGFRVNPFGDLAVVRAAGQTASNVLCAGVRGGEAKTLVWNSGASPAWQAFV